MAGQIVNGHLGGAVDGNMGRDLLTQAHHVQILHDKCVHAGHCRVADQFCQFLTFSVRHQRVEGQMHSHTANMAVLDRLQKSLGGKILSALTGIEHAAA